MQIYPHNIVMIFGGVKVIEYYVQNFKHLFFHQNFTTLLFDRKTKFGFFEGLFFTDLSWLDHSDGLKITPTFNTYLFGRFFFICLQKKLRGKMPIYDIYV